MGRIEGIRGIEGIGGITLEEHSDRDGRGRGVFFSVCAFSLHVILYALNAFPG